MNWYGRDALNRRDWAKICLATLFGLVVSGRDGVSPHVLAFCNEAVASGYRHVLTALGMALADLDEDLETTTQDSDAS